MVYSIQSNGLHSLKIVFNVECLVLSEYNSLIVNCELLIFFARPPLFLAKYIIINELDFSRPPVTPPLRPPIDLPLVLVQVRKKMVDKAIL